MSLLLTTDNTLATNPQFTEEEEIRELEKIIRLRDQIRAGQHAKFKPATAASNQEKPSSTPTLNVVGKNIIANGVPKQPPGMPANKAAARPIPVFPPVLSLPPRPSEQEREPAVVVLTGKDSPQRIPLVQEVRKDQKRDSGWQNVQQNHRPGKQSQDERKTQGKQNGNRSNGSQLPARPPLPVQIAPPPFPPHPLPFPFLPGTLPSFPNGVLPVPPPPPPPLISLPSIEKNGSEPMTLDKPVETPNLVAVPHDERSDENVANNARENIANNIELLKKAQEFIATLPPKPAQESKHSGIARDEAVAKPLPDRRQASDSGHTNNKYNDRRDEDRPASQRQQSQREGRSYNDRRPSEPLRKTAITNMQNSRDDRHWRQGGDIRNNKKRRSPSPRREDTPVRNSIPSFASPQPLRPVDSTALMRSHENHEVVEVESSSEEGIHDAKRRGVDTNGNKDTRRSMLSSEEKRATPPPPPAKQENAPVSPAVTIPRHTPAFEPVSPGRSRPFVAEAERYGNARLPAQYPYRDNPYSNSQHPVQPYGTYDRMAAHEPDAVHVRRPSPPPLPFVRGVPREEYVYGDPYGQDPRYNPRYAYYRRPGSPGPARPSSRGMIPRHRHEDGDPVIPKPVAPVQGRVSPSRQQARAARPRRSSRSLSPPRQRSPPPQNQVNDPREERFLMLPPQPEPAGYPEYPVSRAMVPASSYDYYRRPVIIQERVPVHIVKVVYIDRNDPEGRMYERQRSPPLAYRTRYVDDPETMPNSRHYRERDYDYGPAYDRLRLDERYGREQRPQRDMYAWDYPPLAAPPPTREYVPHPYAAPLPHMPVREYPSYRDYPLPAPIPREMQDDRFHRPEYTGLAPREMADDRIPYRQDPRDPRGPVAPPRAYP